MPIDFDESDIADVVEEVNSPEQQIMSSQEEPQADLEEQMSEVEARLEMAQYYRLVLNETLFEDAPNPAVAERVEEEIRGFIKTRMQVLVGVGEQAPAKAQRIFSDAEIQALRTIAQPDVAQALKALAAKVLKRAAIQEAKPLPAEKSASVLKEPILKKVGQKNTQRMQSVAAPQIRTKSKKQEKKIKVITTEDGREVKMDMTQQARPQGIIQPIPTPRTRDQIEMASAQSAAYQARVALQTLERNLRGKE